MPAPENLSQDARLLAAEAHVNQLQNQLNLRTAELDQVKAELAQMREQVMRLLGNQAGATPDQVHQAGELVEPQVLVPGEDLDELTAAVSGAVAETNRPAADTTRINTPTARTPESTLDPEQSAAETKKKGFLRRLLGAFVHNGRLDLEHARQAGAQAVKEWWKKTHQEKPASPPEADTDADAEKRSRSERANEWLDKNVNHGALVEKVRELAASGKLTPSELLRSIKENPDTRDAIIGMLVQMAVRAAAPLALPASIGLNTIIKGILDRGQYARANQASAEKGSAEDVMALLQRKLREHVARGAYGQPEPGQPEPTDTTATEAAAMVEEADLEIPDDPNAAEVVKRRGILGHLGEWLGRGARLGRDVFMIYENALYKFAMGGQRKLGRVEHLMRDIEAKYRAENPDPALPPDQLVENWLNQRQPTNLAEIVNLLQDLSDLQVMGDVVPDNLGAKLPDGWLKRLLFGKRQEQEVYRQREFIQKLRTQILDYAENHLLNLGSSVALNQTDKRAVDQLRTMTGAQRETFLIRIADHYLGKVMLADLIGTIMRPLTMMAATDALHGLHDVAPTQSSAGGHGAQTYEPAPNQPIVHGRAVWEDRNNLYPEHSPIPNAGPGHVVLEDAGAPGGAMPAQAVDRAGGLVRHVGDKGRSLWDYIGENQAEHVRAPVVNAAKNLARATGIVGDEHQLGEQLGYLKKAVGKFYPEGGHYTLLGSLPKLPDGETLNQMAHQISSGVSLTSDQQNIIDQLAYRLSQDGLVAGSPEMNLLKTYMETIK